MKSVERIVLVPELEQDLFEIMANVADKDGVCHGLGEWMELPDPHERLCGFNAMSNANAVKEFVDRRMSGWDTSRIR